MTALNVKTICLMGKTIEVEVKVEHDDPAGAKVDDDPTRVKVDDEDPTGAKVVDDDPTEVKVDDDPLDVEVDVRKDKEGEETVWKRKRQEVEKLEEEETRKRMKRYVAFFETSKFLTEPDTDSSGRVLVPDSRQLYNALTEEEKDAVLKQGITVFAVDNQNVKYKLNLTKVPRRNKLVINRGWNDVIRRNNLKPNHEMKLRGCRDKGKLCFGLAFNHGIKNNRVDKVMPSDERSQLAY